MNLPNHILEPYELLAAIQTQLTRLQQEVTILSQRMAPPQRAPEFAASLSELGGVWAGTTVDEEDCAAAEWRIPEELL